MMIDKVIKLNDVKTIEQLNVVSDRWYHRAEYLKRIFYNKALPEKTRIKAFKVWQVYLVLLTSISMIYTQASLKASQKAGSSFPKGGIITRKQ